MTHRVGHLESQIGRLGKHCSCISLMCLLACTFLMLIGCGGAGNGGANNTVIRIDAEHGKMITANTVGREMIEERLYTPPPSAADAPRDRSIDNDRKNSIGDRRNSQQFDEDGRLTSASAPPTDATYDSEYQPLPRPGTTNDVIVKDPNDSRNRPSMLARRYDNELDNQAASDQPRGASDQPINPVGEFTRGTGIPREQPTRLAGSSLPDVNAAQFDFENEPAIDGNPIVFAILLSSHTGDNNRQIASQMREVYVNELPQLRGAWLHASSKGSMILLGRYEGFEDPAALEHLQAIKQLRYKNSQPFARAHLARIDLNAGRGNFHPHDLRTLRRLFPKVNPLYSLQVAAWIDVEDDDREWERHKKAAETYAAELRAQGHEAWFYHSEVARTTSVTVGKFDRTAIDSTSGLYSVEARQLIEAFPIHLVNGEQLMVKEFEGQSNSPMKPQGSHMVEVPLSLD